MSVLQSTEEQRKSLELFTDELHEFIMEHAEQDMDVICAAMSSLMGGYLARFPPQRTSLHLSCLLAALSDAQNHRAKDVLQKVETMLHTGGTA